MRWVVLLTLHLLFVLAASEAVEGGHTEQHRPHRHFHRRHHHKSETNEGVAQIQSAETTSETHEQRVIVTPSYTHERMARLRELYKTGVEAKAGDFIIRLNDTTSIDTQQQSQWPPALPTGSDLNWALMAVSPDMVSVLDWEQFVEENNSGAQYVGFIPANGILLLCTAAQGTLLEVKGKKGSSDAVVLFVRAYFPSPQSKIDPFFDADLDSVVEAATQPEVEIVADPQDVDPSELTFPLPTDSLASTTTVTSSSVSGSGSSTTTASGLLLLEENENESESESEEEDRMRLGHRHRHPRRGGHSHHSHPRHQFREQHRAAGDDVAVNLVAYGNWLTSAQIMGEVTGLALGLTPVVIGQEIFIATSKGAADSVALALAGIPSVTNIGVEKVPVANNKWARAVYQGGSTAATATPAARYPLLPLGITGDGITVGVSDTGVTPNGCFFHHPNAPQGKPVNSGTLIIKNIRLTAVAPVGMRFDFQLSITPHGANAIAVPTIIDGYTSAELLWKIPVTDIEATDLLRVNMMPNPAVAIVGFVPALILVPIPQSKDVTVTSEIHDRSTRTTKGYFSDLFGAFRTISFTFLAPPGATQPGGTIAFDIAFDNTDPGLRKISRYVSLYADNGDQDRGHGTHVAGTVLGKAETVADGDDAAIGVFNGVAPGAKLVFFDLANQAEGDAGLGAATYAREDFKAVRGSGGRIMSHSWGTAATEATETVRMYYGSFLTGDYLRTRFQSGGDWVWIRKDHKYQALIPPGSNVYVIQTWPTLQPRPICTITGATAQGGNGRFATNLGANQYVCIFPGGETIQSQSIVAQNMRGRSTYGGGVNGQSFNYDLWLFQDKDAVLFQSAGNEGTAALQNNGYQAASKNTVTVGAAKTVWQAWAETVKLSGQACGTCFSLTGNTTQTCAQCSDKMTKFSTSSRMCGQAGTEHCLTGFSSIGPPAAAADAYVRRIKPDVVGIGHTIVSARGGEMGASCSAATGAKMWTEGAGYHTQVGVAGMPTYQTVWRLNFAAGVGAARTVALRPVGAAPFTAPAGTNTISIQLECAHKDRATPVPALTVKVQHNIAAAGWNDVGAPCACGATFPPAPCVVVDGPGGGVVAAAAIEYRITQVGAPNDQTNAPVLRNIAIWATDLAGVVMPMFYQATFGTEAITEPVAAVAIGKAKGSDGPTISLSAASVMLENGLNAPNGARAFATYDLAFPNGGSVFVKFRMNSINTGAATEQQLCCDWYVPNTYPIVFTPCLSAGGVGAILPPAIAAAARCVGATAVYQQVVWKVPNNTPVARVRIMQNSAALAVANVNSIIIGQMYITAAASAPTELVYSTQGTSMSTPSLAGLAALYDEYLQKGFYPKGVADNMQKAYVSGQMLKAMMIHSSRPFKSPDRTADYFETEQGAGMPSFSNLFHMHSLPGPSLWFTRTDPVVLPLAPAVVAATAFPVFRFAQPSLLPVRITLTWYDLPATANTGNMQINLDLSLECVYDVTQAAFVYRPTYPTDLVENNVEIMDYNPDYLCVYQTVKVQVPLAIGWAQHADARYRDFPQSFSLLVSGERGYMKPVIYPVELLLTLSAWVKPGANGDNERVCTVRIEPGTTADEKHFICNKRRNSFTLNLMQPLGMFPQIVIRVSQQGGVAEVISNVVMFDTTNGNVFVSDGANCAAVPVGAPPAAWPTWQDGVICNMKPQTYASTTAAVTAASSLYHITIWSKGQQEWTANQIPTFNLVLNVNTNEGGPFNFAIDPDEPLQGLKDTAPGAVLENFRFPGNPRSQEHHAFTTAFTNDNFNILSLTPPPPFPNALGAATNWEISKIRVVDFWNQRVMYHNPTPATRVLGKVPAVHPILVMPTTYNFSSQAITTTMPASRTCGACAYHMAALANMETQTALLAFRDATLQNAMNQFLIDVVAVNPATAVSVRAAVTTMYTSFNNRFANAGFQTAQATEVCGPKPTLALPLLDWEVCNAMIKKDLPAAFATATNAANDLGFALRDGFRQYLEPAIQTQYAFEGDDVQLLDETDNKCLNPANLQFAPCDDTMYWHVVAGGVDAVQAPLAFINFLNIGAVPSSLGRHWLKFQQPGGGQCLSFTGTTIQLGACALPTSSHWRLEENRLFTKQNVHGNGVICVSRNANAVGALGACPGLLLTADHLFNKKSANFSLGEVVQLKSTTGFCLGPGTADATVATYEACTDAQRFTIADGFNIGSVKFQVTTSLVGGGGNALCLCLNDANNAVVIAACTDQCDKWKIRDGGLAFNNGAFCTDRNIVAAPSVPTVVACAGFHPSADATVFPIRLKPNLVLRESYAMAVYDRAKLFCDSFMLCNWDDGLNDQSVELATRGKMVHMLSTSAANTIDEFSAQF